MSGNKYERKAEEVIDLHGHTTAEARVVLDELIKGGKYKHVRVVTGKGAFRETGPVMRTFVQNYLAAHGVRYNPSKFSDGGEGALEVFLK